MYQQHKAAEDGLLLSQLYHRHTFPSNLDVVFFVALYGYTQSNPVHRANSRLWNIIMVNNREI